MTDFIKKESNNNLFISFLDLKKEKRFTKREKEQARQLKNYLAYSGGNRDLYLFLEKALNIIQEKDL